MEKPFAWNPDKNEQLKARHGFGFEDIVQVIETEGILDNVANPSANFEHQRLLIIRLEGYPMSYAQILVTADLGGFLKLLNSVFESTPFDDFWQSIFAR